VLINATQLPVVDPWPEGAPAPAVGRLTTVIQRSGRFVLVVDRLHGHTVSPTVDTFIRLDTALGVCSYADSDVMAHRVRRFWRTS
jgi:hypothetical protein